MTEPVVIIGTGAGGGAAAWMLTQKGIPVIALEAGPAFDPARDYTLNQSDWELKEFPYKTNSQSTYSFGALQALDPTWDHLRSWNVVAGRSNTGNSRQVSGTGHHHVRGVGGSTLHFTGEAHRLMPDSLTPSPTTGITAWPVDYDTLEPWYTLAESAIGVAGPLPGEQELRWRSRTTLQPAHPFCAASRLVQSKSGSDFNWVANTRAALSKPLDGRPDCNYCANCQMGCPRGDKGSADVTFIRQAQATGLLQLRTECQVTRLILDESNRISDLLYVDAKGEQHQIHCSQLILAAGAVETPRLLLNSPQIAALNNQIGKHLMMHLSWISSGMVTDDILTHRGLPADMVCWDYCHTGQNSSTVGGYRIGVSTTEIRFTGPINYAQRAVPGWGRSHKQAMRQRFGKALSIGAIGASLPNSKTFIDLDPVRKDRVGMPLARIHHYLPDTELERLTRMQATCREVLKLSGAAGLVEEYGNYDFISSTHTLGTCRMGSSSEDSVTDTYGRFHAIENLHICDASLFPNSGNGEAPSLTVEALALRTASRLADRLL